MKPLCIDLFCGYGGWARGFLDAGYRVVGFDNEPKCAKRYPGEFVLADVRNLDGRRFRGARVIVASPPCTGFSVAGLQWHWKGNAFRFTTRFGISLVENALRIVKEAKPEYWVIENPTGMLRKILGYPRETIYQCSYGARWKKPTDLWGDYPIFLELPCGPHEAAPHGKATGLQGTRNPNLRAQIPTLLARTLAEACLP